MGRQIRIIVLFSLIAISNAVWSQVTDSVIFEDLVAIALQNNFGLIIARNESEAERISNNIGNAGFLPVADVSVNKSYSVVNSNQEFYDGRTREASGAHNNSFSALAEVNWTIFDGTKMFVTKTKLSELEKMGMTAVQIRAELLYLNLATIYYQLVQEQTFLESLKANLEISLERLKLAQKKFDIGSAAETDLIQARLDLGNDSTAVLDAEARIVGLKADINNLLSRDPEIAFSAKDRIPINDTLDYLSLLSTAEQQNKELIYARQNERISELSHKQTVAEFLPEISLYGDYNYSKLSSETGLLASSRTYGPSYGIRFSYNIFNGLNDKLQYQLTRIEYENARLNTESTINLLHTDLYKTYTLYSSALENSRIHKQLVGDALKNLTIAIELYKRGQINEIDFRATQQKAIAAENKLLIAQYLVRTSELELLILSGQLTLTPE
jgi:outer membrane protein